MSILRVQMTSGKVVTGPSPKEKIIGGRGMIDDLMTEFGTPTVHPLSKESLLIIAPGFFSGTVVPQSGRLSIGGKSPLTGGIKEANVGGTAAHKLGRLGVRAIMVEGRDEEWQILHVRTQGAILEPAADIMGLMNYAACERLRKRYGESIGIILTGPAGEMRLSNSTVAVTDPEGRPSRHAARGGVGALMASKGLKAIVVDDREGSMRKPRDEEAFKEAVRLATEKIKAGPLAETLHRLGTPLLIDVDNARGSLPTNNYRLGAFEKFQNINASRLVEMAQQRGGSMGHSCMSGCIIRCSPVFHDASGQYLTSALEFETLAMLGSNLGIDDLDAIARMDRRCDEFGLDTIEMGATIGVLNDVGLFEFGDAARAEDLIGEVGRGTALGRVLGSGVATAAKVFGINRVPEVKGQAIPGHSARSLKGWGVTYATSPQGADHTAGIVQEDPLSPTGQGQRSIKAQIAAAALDATGFCLFTGLWRWPEAIVRLINAFYGVHWTVEDYLEMGRTMLRQENAFNLKAGIGPGADRLPDWMSEEPLPPTNAVFDVPRKDFANLFEF
jgi:aldehyde:ferredoxin oxidoreductase